MHLPELSLFLSRRILYDSSIILQTTHTSDNNLGSLIKKKILFLVSLLLQRVVKYLSIDIDGY